MFSGLSLSSLQHGHQLLRQPDGLILIPGLDALFTSLPGKDQELGRTVAYQLLSFVLILFQDKSSDTKFRTGNTLTARIRRASPYLLSSTPTIKFSGPEFLKAHYHQCNSWMNMPACASSSPANSTTL